MAESSQPLQFLSGALSDGLLEVRAVRGREELSRLFWFEIVLAQREGPLSADDLDAMLKAPCVLALGHGDHDIVHGILERIELVESVPRGAAIYRARMVPGAWLLTLARTNRVFQNLTVADIVEQILSQYGLSKDNDFAMLIRGGEPREYVVQYEESDWDFIQRWLEDEGAFYWFEQSASGEKIIFANSNDDATAIASPSQIEYRQRNTLESGGESSIWDWTFVQKRIPARVAVVDHNYRTPSVPLIAVADVDPARGFGTVFHYNEHFKSTDEGAGVAKTRAERYLCERRTFHGRSDCARLRVGHTFELANHHDGSMDGKYLVTAIDHEGSVPVAGGEQEVIAYRATFDAIPVDVVFRPERLTPWPAIHGVLHAHVDADSDGAYAQLDDKGRYKVRLPFDGSGNKGSGASRWMRMAQPYTGAGYGQHFPLHKGAEVLLGHVDGDPDRPIIVGAVPCAHTPSPSTNSNATQSVIQTASGIRIEMEDNQS